MVRRWCQHSIQEWLHHRHKVLILVYWMDHHNSAKYMWTAQLIVWKAHC
jgi:hypothetical protein